MPIGQAQVSLFWSLRVDAMDGFFAGDFAAWRRRVESLWPDAADVVAAASGPDQFFRAVYRDVAVGRWNRGGCVVIGDAAHGTSPQLGQGANLALIDAVELAAVLRPAPPARSLARYQAARRRQTAVYQLVSRILTPLFQSDSAVWGWARDWLFAPIVRAPVIRWFVAGGLTGTARLGPTPKALRL